jgi:hypothetical protein
MKLMKAAGLILMLGIAAGAFGQTILVNRTIGATSDTGHSNPHGYIKMTYVGTGVSSSNVKTGQLNFIFGNSAGSGVFGSASYTQYIGSATWTASGVLTESDSGDASFQTFSTFQLETEAHNSMGYVIKIVYADGTTDTFGSWPAYGHSSNAVNWDNTYDYPTSIVAKPRQSFQIKIWAYWDYESDSSWEADGPFIYHFTYSPDTTPPTVTPASPGPLTWGKTTPSWTYTATDSRGVGSITFQAQSSTDGVAFANIGSPIVKTNTALDSPFTTTVQPLQGISPAPGDGYYRVLVTAKNADGVATATSIQSSVYGFDTHPPVFASQASASYSSDGTIRVDWGAASDTQSGLAATPYQVTYSISGGAQVPLSVASGQTTASLPFVPAYYGATVAFTVQAVDQGGNVATSVASVKLPPLLSMITSLDPASNSQTMLVDLQFNVTPQVLKAGFTNIVVARDPVVSNTTGVTLGATILDTATISLNGTGTFTPSGSWTVNAQGNVCYVDAIPVSSGAGHKTWRYTPLPSGWVGAPLASSTVALSNHPGTVIMAISDMNGVVYSPDTASQFQLGADRKVFVRVLASDPDRDNWSYEVDRVGQTDGQNPLASYVRLSGQAPADYPYANGYSQQSVPVTLTEGINNLEVLWKEGDIDGFHSAVLPALVTAAGVFQIQTSTSDGTTLPISDTIVTRPGEKLTFRLPPPPSGTTYSWNFDDGNGFSAPGNVNEMVYAYAQVVGQTADNAPHTLTVSISDGTSTQTSSLNILVKDTQTGTLYVSETWMGDHAVTGVVEVPAGLKLTIGSDSSQPKVTFAGGGSSGILVDSTATLKIGDGFVLTGDSSAWGSIDIHGYADVGASTIQGASQGIVAEPDSSIVLKGTTLQNNQTGLHVVGSGSQSPSVTLGGVNVVNNLFYGIKEDTGGRPKLSATSVSSNFRNYYSFDQGLLTLDGINALNAAYLAQLVAASAPYATPNTGDTSWGTDQ